MLKQEYIKMRNSGKWNLQWFYKYFLENGGKLSQHDFYENFQYEREKIRVAGGFIENRQERDLQPIIAHLDKKFELTMLFNNNGEFIKVVE